MITYSVLNRNSEPVGQKMTITGALLFMETLARTYEDESHWILYREPDSEEEEAPVEEQKDEPYVPEIVKGLLGNLPEATEEVPAEEQ